MSHTTHPPYTKSPDELENYFFLRWLTAQHGSIINPSTNWAPEVLKTVHAVQNQTVHVPPACLEVDHTVADPVVDLLVPPGDPWRRAHNNIHQPQSATSSPVHTDGKLEVTRLQNFTNGGLSALCKGASSGFLPAENAPDLSQVREGPAEQEKPTSERSNHSKTTQFNPNNGSQGTSGKLESSEDHREVRQQSDDQQPVRTGQHSVQATAAGQHQPDATPSASLLDSSVESPSSRRHTHYEAVLSSSTPPHAIGDSDIDTTKDFTTLSRTTVQRLDSKTCQRPRPAAQSDAGGSVNEDSLDHPEWLPERDQRQARRRNTPKVASEHDPDRQHQGPSNASSSGDLESGFEAGLRRLQRPQGAQKPRDWRPTTASVDGGGSVGSISLPPPEVEDQSYHDNTDTGSDQGSAPTPLASQWTDAESMELPVPLPQVPNSSSSHQPRSRRQPWTAAQPLQAINLGGLEPLHPLHAHPQSSIMSPSLYQLSPPLHDGTQWPGKDDDRTRLGDQGGGGTMPSGNEWTKQLASQCKPPYHKGCSADVEASAGRGAHGNSMDRQSSSSSMSSLFPTASHTAPPRAQAIESTTGCGTSAKTKGGSAPAPAPIHAHWHSKLIQDQPDSTEAVGNAHTSTHTTPYTAPHGAPAPLQPFSLRMSSQGGSWSRSWSGSDSPMHLLSPRYRLEKTSSSVSIEEVLASTAAQQPLRLPAAMGQSLPGLKLKSSSSATHHELPPKASARPCLGALLASASLPTAWRCSRHVSDWIVHHLTDSISLDKLDEHMQSAKIRDCVWKSFHDSVHAEACQRLQRLPGRPMRISDLQQCRAIAKGGFGTIFDCVHRTTGLHYAVKRMCKQFHLDRGMISSCFAERDAMMAVQGPFTVPLTAALQTSTHLYLVQPLMVTDLGSVITSKRRLPHTQVRFYAAQLVLALQHIHRAGYMYRDLKPENVLLDDDGYIRVADFGLARKTRCTRGRCGTRGYWAPEMLRTTDSGRSKQYCDTVDWWSLGCVIYECYVGECPFRSRRAKTLRPGLSEADNMDLATLRGRVRCPDFMPPDAVDLVERLLCRDSESRLGAGGADEVRGHAYFEGLDWDELEGRRVPVESIPSFPRRRVRRRKRNANAVKNEKLGGWAASDNAFHSWNVTSVTQCRHDVVRQLDAWAGMQAKSPYFAGHHAPDDFSLQGVSATPHQNHTRVRASAAPELDGVRSASNGPSTSSSGVPSAIPSTPGSQLPPTGHSTDGSQLLTSHPSADPSPNRTPVPCPRPFRAATTPWYGPTWDEYVFLVPGQRCISLSGTFSDTAAPWHAQSPLPRLSAATADRLLAQRRPKSHDHSTAAQRKTLHGHAASSSKRRDSGPPNMKAVSAEAALNLRLRTTDGVRHGNLYRQDSITLASQSTPALTRSPKVHTKRNTEKCHARGPGGKKVSPAARRSAESMEPDGGGPSESSGALTARRPGMRCCNVQ